MDIVHRYNQSSIECMDMNSIGLFGLCTAWDLLGTLQTVDENSPVKGKRYNYIVSMCRSFDDLLGGGFPTGRLTELCGEPGVGKTQFCFDIWSWMFHQSSLLNFLDVDK
ncbi:unnamed protein product [Schistosoma mattheei]|uniref:KaiC-like domain-containing protein n=1 Tax=Schistosoma mattheei TaxID=31246 RepID=A0A3P8BFZ0_9TREM|nr:unnamed protein product [Schistosoma mattheei]